VPAVFVASGAVSEAGCCALTLRVQTGLARLVLRHLVRRMLLALLAEGLRGAAGEGGWGVRCQCTSLFFSLGMVSTRRGDTASKTFCASLCPSRITGRQPRREKVLETARAHLLGLGNVHHLIDRLLVGGVSCAPKEGRPHSLRAVYGESAQRE
jgi:hypothetical protein